MKKILKKERNQGQMKKKNGNSKRFLVRSDKKKFTGKGERRILIQGKEKIRIKREMKNTK